MNTVIKVLTVFWLVAFCWLLKIETYKSPVLHFSSSVNTIQVFLNEPSLASFSFIFVFSNKHYNSNNKYMWKMLWPSSIQHWEYTAPRSSLVKEDDKLVRIRHTKKVCSTYMPLATLHTRLAIGLILLFISFSTKELYGVVATMWCHRDINQNNERVICRLRSEQRCQFRRQANQSKCV